MAPPLRSKGADARDNSESPLLIELLRPGGDDTLTDLVRRLAGALAIDLDLDSSLFPADAPDALSDSS